MSESVPAKDQGELTDSPLGEPFELISVPVPPIDKEYMLPPAKTPNNDAPKQLCGYLMKQVKQPLTLQKAWKPKWFVFDEKRCCLFYYNDKADFNAQGKIDISTATLSYEVENLSKNQFEILSEGRSISLQASSSEAMMYWLTQLQNKRRRFSLRRRPNHQSTESDLVQEDTASGLVGASTSQENLIDLDNETTPLSNPLAPSSPPSDLEDRQAFVSEAAPLHPRSLSTRLKGRFTKQKVSPGVQRKTGFKSHLKPTGEELETTANGSTPHDGGQSAVTSEPLESVENKSLRGTRMSISKFWGRKTADYAPCNRCQQLEETVSILESELKTREREVSDRDEINEFLRNEIRMNDMRDKAKQDLLQAEGSPSPGEEKKVDVLLQREQTIEELQKLLERAIEEKDRATTELKAKRLELEALGEQVVLFKEALAAKDHVVVELTNEVFKLEHKGQVPNNPQDVMMPTRRQSYEEEIHKLEETVEAYKQQNRFLSSELVELNTVRAEDSAVHKMLENKHYELEAEHCRIQSKYMILLQESQQPRMGDTGPDNSMVSRMLEEALNTEEKTPAVDISSYDCYGFSNTHAASDVGLQSDPLTVKARKLDQQAHRAFDETAASKRERWEALVSGRELQRSDEVKRLIRGGIPQSHRSTVWKWMVRDTLGRAYIEGQYEAILHQHANQSSIAVNQIELDLLRTLPTNKYYESPDAQGIDKLRRILVAFSWFDPDVGYCQGLNRLAAIALLFLSEEDAFWCLVAIVHHLLPKDYYSQTLLGSQTDQRVLRDLLQDHTSKLCNHLTICDIDLSMITFNWFHTIFVDNLPVETMLRIWDTFLYEGSKVLFRFAIAIFKYNEQELLSIENSIGIFNRLRFMCQDATDVNRLAQIAFTEIGRFPMRIIAQKRDRYRVEIKAELAALNQLRSSHPANSVPTAKYVKTKKEDESGSDVEETIFLDPPPIDKD